MFAYGFEKHASLKQKHVEDVLGMYLDKKHKKEVSQLIDKEKSERLGLRHPWLTGIPTLGIWPRVSRDNAAVDVADEMLRNNPGLRKEVEKMRADAFKREQELLAKEHQREVELMTKHIADREAASRERMLGMGVTGGLSALNTIMTKKKED